MGLEQKIIHIQEFLASEKPDMLALVETHTFREDVSWLQNTFLGYSVLSTNYTKHSHFKNYRQNLEKDIHINQNNLTEEEKLKALAKINEYNKTYFRGVVLLINDEISHICFSLTSSQKLFLG